MLLPPPQDCRSRTCYIPSALEVLFSQVLQNMWRQDLCACYVNKDLYVDKDITVGKPVILVSGGGKLTIQPKTRKFLIPDNGNTIAELLQQIGEPISPYYLFVQYKTNDNREILVYTAPSNSFVSSQVMVYGYDVTDPANPIRISEIIGTFDTRTNQLLITNFLYEPTNNTTVKVTYKPRRTITVEGTGSFTFADSITPVERLFDVALDIRYVTQDGIVEQYLDYGYPELFYVQKEFVGVTLEGQPVAVTVFGDEVAITKALLVSRRGVQLDPGKSYVLEHAIQVKVNNYGPFTFGTGSATSEITLRSDAMFRIMPLNKGGVHYRNMILIDERLGVGSGGGWL